ncbi:hypothetical protein [Nostoc phage Nsp-JY18]
MSEIRTDLLSNRLGTGPAPLRDQWPSKAWVNFNGTGTVAIRESRNTSSITDHGVGDYTSNLTVAQVDANYSVSTSAKGSNDASQSLATFLSASSPLATTSFRARVVQPAVAYADSDTVTLELTR